MGFRRGLPRNKKHTMCKYSQRLRPRLYGGFVLFLFVCLFVCLFFILKKNRLLVCSLLFCLFFCFLFCLFRGIPLKPIVEALSTIATVPYSKKLDKQNVTIQIKKKITFPAGL